MKGVIKYLGHVVFGKKGEPITTQVDAWKQEADCGCGIDCCNKKIVMTDQTTGAKVSLYFNNGEILADFGEGGIVQVTTTRL